jgi:branched-subunit amino acid aminotransferase/4-amino-4-deoxychorismate lyase
MLRRLQKYISILKIELQDLEEDIKDVIQALERRKETQEITPYVYLENKGLLLSEIAGVRAFLDEVAAIPAERYQSVEEMIRDAERRVEQRTKEGAFPAVVHDLVKRRMEKARAAL